MSNQFDALGYAHDLETAGVPPEQARIHASALVEALEKNVASHADLRALEHALTAEIARSMSTIEARLLEQNSRMATSEIKINARFEQVEAKMDAGFEQANTRFKQIESKMDAGFEQAESKMNARFAQSGLDTETKLMSIRGEIILLKWMVGTMIGLTLALVVKAFS